MTLPHGARIDALRVASMYRQRQADNDGRSI